MHGQVYGFFEQSFFQLFDENSFAADLRDGSVQHFITGGFDDNDLRLDAGRGKQTLADKFRLPFRVRPESVAWLGFTLGLEREHFPRVIKNRRGRALLGAGRSPLALGGLAVLRRLSPSERWSWARRGSRRCPDGEQAAHLARPQAQLLAALDERQLVDPRRMALDIAGIFLRPGKLQQFGDDLADAVNLFVDQPEFDLGFFDLRADHAADDVEIALHHRDRVVGHRSAHSFTA